MMKVADFTVEFGGASSLATGKPIWAFDHDDENRCWQLVRRRGIGSYAVRFNQRDRELVLEEHDAPDQRELIDRLNHMQWVAWAARELRAMLDAGEAS
jgi:hypothetical protein